MSNIVLWPKLFFPYFYFLGPEAHFRVFDFRIPLEFSPDPSTLFRKQKKEPLSGSFYTILWFSIIPLHPLLGLHI